MKLSRFMTSSTGRFCQDSAMPKLRVHNFSISLDGYAAGPDQSLDAPLGVGGTALHDWIFETRSGRRGGAGWRP